MPASPELRQFLQKRVVAQLDGPALDGKIVSLGADSFLLADVVHIDPTGGRTPMDGSVLVERARVLWIQIPEEGQPS